MELPKFLTDLDPKIYLSDNFIVLDKEVTNHDKGSALNRDNRHLLTVWTDGPSGNQYVLERGNEYQLGHLLERIERADFIVAHNAKFELQWLQREGLDISKVLVWDTMIAEYVLLGNQKKPLGLDAVAHRRGIGGKENYISCCIKHGICPSDLPASMLASYCVQDVALTLSLFKIQLKELQERNLLPVMFTRCIFTPVLADLEGVGMHLDKDRVEQEYRNSIAELQELEIELNELVGYINLGSPKQVAELLYGDLKFKQLTKYGKVMTTPSGNPMTDSATIGKLVAKTKKQKKFKELYIKWNSLKASLSKNLEFFYGVVTEVEDSVFYAQFNQTVTQTHRLSSSGKKLQFKKFKKSKGVQFQNFPRKYKRLFNARREGWKVGERDGAQLEFRVAAHLGRDSAATRDIRDGFDVHSFTASILFDVSVEWMLEHKESDPIAKEYRQLSKAHTFKPLYGGSSGTETEQKYYAAFKERYPGVADAQQSWIDTVLRDKKLVTETGLIFYWPDTTITQSGYITNTTSICNYPVQSLATADIIPIAVTYMWHKMKAAGLQGFIVNTIHDSVITEEPEEESEIIDKIAREAFMEDVYNYLDKVYNIQFTVPLDVDSKVKSHWGSD